MRKMTSEFASIDNESSESGDYANDEKWLILNKSTVLKL